MVLENMVSGEEAESKPWHVFVYTLIATSVSMYIASMIFPAQSSVTFLFLITIASTPMVYRVLSDEEAEDENYERIDLGFLSIHKKAFMVYTHIFLGVLAATSFWYTILPQDYVSQAFSEQIKTYERIRGESIATGMLTAGSAADFASILSNNLSVSIISMMLSFFYGVGAVFILAWNASVIAVFMGNMARVASAGISHPIGPVYGYLAAVPAGILSISLHGVPEIAAYFIAGIAGGILSIGIRNGHNGRILKDAIALFGLSVALLVAAAFLEVWVTPNL